jgi:tetratricopeptide (TPR) repeat protein
MRNKDLISFMNNPCSMQENILSELRRLSEEFPYFQTTKLLYLKLLSKLKDSAYASELKKTSIYSGDRKRLFYLLAGEHLEKIRIALAEGKLSSETKSFELIDVFLKTIGNIDEDTEQLPALPEYSSYALQGMKETAEAQAPALKHEDIIDRFLDENKEHPFRQDLQMEPPSALPATQQEEVEDVLPEDSLSFSETLAKIYTKQQKYDKALEIIRKLSLLYPEKSVYFASQIESLERLITKNK